MLRLLDEMPLVGKVGRKRIRARIAMGVLYGLLSVGALTTLYPFLVMVSTGFKGVTDQNDNRLVPKFWSDLGELQAKYRDDKYAGDLAQLASTSLGGQAPEADVRAYEKLLMELPLHEWTAGFRQAPTQVTGRLNIRYQSWLRERYPTIDALNQAYIEENVGFQTVAPPAELFDRAFWKPRPGKKWDDWLVFKAQLPVEFRLPLRKNKRWQDYVRGVAQNQFDQVPADWKGAAKTFDQLVAPDSTKRLTDAKVDQFYAGFEKSLSQGIVEDEWRKRGSGDLPILAMETRHVEAQAGALKREFSTRNYRYVLDFVLLNGRALWNTLIFCALAVLLQLIVNPLAAYALSRYPMKSTGKILLFLLATMAFPAEVAMIPSFLLLRDLGLLNTFAALVLPAAASGYMIFLLKGFFDSLPQELYESGAMDGARERTMLWKIALPLSKPVLGYLALMAFMASYGAFMYAFLVAQDQRMWTLMVWIYQLQQGAPMSVTMAALTLAAIPTLLVFFLAQRVILRGIVLPGER
ncbi:MAG TPA: carbohydrate ABC transporter permease [Fimbriimonadaceae bacterium]|nr:carbohydrate ABC transporter permease [Fimbriimonadaceae bacterium]HRJ32453.1 carbohydrate ABC transporter permease [Fimbriimonadaceae bacterium]